MINFTYKGFEIEIEYNGLVDWGYQVKEFPYHRDNWGYLSSVLALNAAQNEIDKICAPDKRWNSAQSLLDIGLQL
jgi:hypothetical protein